jgi:hypothetical protein
MPLQATSGAASQDGFGGNGVPIIPNYIEEVFSTYLYTGTGASQTITNGIDLSTNGGLTWIKGRSDATSHRLTDTARGVTKSLASNSASSQLTESTGLTAFGTTGFTIGADTDYNTSASTYVSWTLRKQTKFFDIVTWSGDSVYPRTITHNLGSAAGCIITKNTTESSDWFTYHRSLGNFQAIRLNTTATPFVSSNNLWNSTSTSFTLTADLGMNESASTYVAYIFAHDAGGFGLTGTDNVISCGSFTQSIGGFVNLGFEPQWVLTKRTSGVDDWRLFDNMRGMTMGDDSLLNPNLSAAENNSAGNDYLNPQPTGFTTIGFDSGTHIYIAIRRGPMKVPTSGTSVFGPNATSGTGANTTVTGGQTDDAVIIRNRGATIGDLFASRLTGTGYLDTTSTAAEVAAGTTILQANPWDVMDGVKVGTTSTITNASSNTFINYLFKRAPSFMDVVCYTGTGSNTTVSHNLGVVPDLIIVKRRDAIEGWQVYSSVMANTEYLLLNGTAAKATDATRWNSTTPTSSVFSVGTSTTTNASAGTYIAYLFSTCAGVSKVGSYAGTGTTIQVDCGFTSGARFVMIRRIDGSGNWWIWDTARGIVSGNDPYFKINNTDPEVANEDLLDPYSAGFEVSTGGAFFNASGFTYLFLAIA